MGDRGGFINGGPGGHGLRHRRWRGLLRESRRAKNQRQAQPSDGLENRETHHFYCTKRPQIKNGAPKQRPAAKNLTPQRSGCGLMVYVTQFLTHAVIRIGLSGRRTNKGTSSICPASRK